MYQMRHVTHISVLTKFNEVSFRIGPHVELVLFMHIHDDAYNMHDIIFQAQSSLLTKRRTTSVASDVTNLQNQRLRKTDTASYQVW